MKLQRYEPHIYGSLLGDSRVLFEASDTGEWVKADEAIALEKEIARLRAALAAEVRLTVHAIETRDAELIANDEEIESLKAQIAAMRRCEICKHYANDYLDAKCVGCADKTSLPKWELAR
jgi:hypothetical protein